MLESLYIENVAVIEKDNIDFDIGLNIITGETGAGKSIIIDSINAILGHRVSRDMIRTGADSAFISAVFRDLSKKSLELVSKLGYKIEEDGSLIIQREINSNGKTTCKINGRPATVSILKEIGDSLINIHGQHESYGLLSSDLHINYIDAMAKTSELLNKYRQAYDAMKNIESKLNDLLLDESEKERKIDLLKYQIDEIESADLTLGEYEQLESKKKLYINSEKISKSILESKSLIDGEENSPGAIQLIDEASNSLLNISSIFDEVSNLQSRIKNAFYELEDCSQELNNLLFEIEYDPIELENIESRLDLIYKLGKKYGDSIEDMLSYLEKAKQELSNIESLDDRISELKNEYNNAKKLAVDLAQELSNIRSKAAFKFSEDVSYQLSFLDMQGVDFCVSQERKDLSFDGVDKIQFLISTNPGEPKKPISKVASGGELSRIMLAIKSVLSDNDDVKSMIFDEIDTGISGSAARKVGLKLKEVSQNRQVICVTHLAQIASLADKHLLIEKRVIDGKTFTNVKNLNMQQRAYELARIIGADVITDKTLENAKEMLKMSNV